MPRTATRPRRRPVSRDRIVDTPVAPRDFLAGADAATLFEFLENHYTDRGDEDGSPYRRLYREAREAALEMHGAVEFAALLDAVDESTGVETATRRAAFIVGFDYCRQLLLGTLDLEALKGGAQ
jgi:hypothetical protein